MQNSLVLLCTWKERAPLRSRIWRQIGEGPNLPRTVFVGPSLALIELIKSCEWHTKMPFYCQGLSVNEKSKTMILLFAEKLSTSFYRMNGRNAFSVVKGFYHYTRKLKKMICSWHKKCWHPFKGWMVWMLIQFSKGCQGNNASAQGKKRLWHSFRRNNILNG